MPIRGLSRRDQPLFRPNVVLNSHQELHIRLRSTASGFAESPLLWLNVRFAVVKPTSSVSERGLHVAMGPSPGHLVLIAPSVPP
jgi:hypothetical protein